MLSDNLLQAGVDLIERMSYWSQARSQPTASGGQPDFWEGGPRVDITTHANRLSYKHNVFIQLFYMISNNVQ